MNVTRLRHLARHHGSAGLLIAGMWLCGYALAAHLRPLRRGYRLVLLCVVAVCLFAGAHVARLHSHGMRAALRITFLDVGKGDAMVLETPSGKCVVIDTGGVLQNGEDRGRTVVLPYLRSRKVKRLDLLLLTHPHPDHVGGAATLLQNLPVSELVDNGLDSSNKTYKRYREEAQRRKVPCVVAARGWRLDCKDGVVLSAVAPPQQRSESDLSAIDPAVPQPGVHLRTLIPPSNIGRRGTNEKRPLENVNNTSIVLRVEYGKTSFLLTGDAETESENEMIRSRQPLRSDVLKVGHHGGKQSTSARFLEAVRPRYAIISVNANNRNGHPDPQVLERLQKAGAQILRTDEHGSITGTSDGRTLRFDTER